MALVLIADEHEDTVGVLSAEIEAEGHSVAIVMSGREACERIAADHPDLVLLGPSLAVHDGYETCALLRADPDVPERLPVLMLGSSDLDRRRMERSGVTASFPREHGSADVRELLARFLNP